MSSFTKGEKVLCKLCQKCNHRMKPLIQMKVSHHHVYEWLCTSESAVTDHSMICLPCIKYIQRNMGEENFHSRRKGKCSEKMKCAIEDCEADVSLSVTKCCKFTHFQNLYKTCTLVHFDLRTRRHCGIF